MESLRAGQEVDGLQPAGRGWGSPGPDQRHLGQVTCGGAHGADGGGQPQKSVCQRPHLPHQLNIRQQRWRDVHIGRRPPD